MSIRLSRSVFSTGQGPCWSETAGRSRRSRPRLARPGYLGEALAEPYTVQAVSGRHCGWPSPPVEKTGRLRLRLDSDSTYPINGLISDLLASGSQISDMHLYRCPWVGDGRGRSSEQARGDEEWCEAVARFVSEKGGWEEG